MRPESAVMELTRLGFRFRIEGEAVKVRWEGQEKPDPEQVAPLLSLVKMYKEDVRYFVKSYCPKCGGCCFIDGVCMACDWGLLVELYPDLKVRN
jgi:hypothetical protein